MDYSTDEGAKALVQFPRPSRRNGIHGIKVDRVPTPGEDGGTERRPGRRSSGERI